MEGTHVQMHEGQQERIPCQFKRNGSRDVTACWPDYRRGGCPQGLHVSLPTTSGALRPLSVGEDKSQTEDLCATHTCAEGNGGGHED